MNKIKKLTVVLLLFGILVPLLLNGCSSKTDTGSLETKNLEGINKKMQELQNEEATLTQELKEKQNKYVSFRVSGKIIDRSENVVQIFGGAFPSNGDWEAVPKCFLI